MTNDIQIFNSQFFDPTGTGIVFAKSSNENEMLFTTNYILADFFNKSVGAINKQIKQSQETVSKAFYDSKSINMKRQLIHQVSKPDTKSLTDAIKDSTAIHGNGYINVWNEIYKASLNKTTQRLKKEHNVPKGKNTLDYLSVEELSAVNKIKPIVIGLVSAGLNYKEIGQSLEVIKNKIIIERPKKLMLPMVI